MEAEFKRKEALRGQQKAIQKRWLWCVENASQNAINLNEIKCRIDHRPDPRTIEELESQTVKLEYYDANRDTRNYGGPNTRNLPEEWFIKVRTPEKTGWVPN